MTITRPVISDQEFAQRAKRLQQIMQREQVDLLLAFGNEAEPQFARYLCDYWPSFETTGVLLAQTGDPILLIGPESYTFAKDRSKVREIRRLAAFRESSNPEYPGEKLETFAEVIEELKVHPKCFAIAGYNLIPHITFMELKASLQKFGPIEPIRGDDLVMELRMVKSEAEIACMRHAGKITALAMDEVIAKIEPGMTELQVRGIACDAIYRHGAENEAYPMWILAGEGSDQAISRARQKVIGKDDAVHLMIGARYEGYASTIGRQVFFGQGHDRLIDAVKTGYDAHSLICEQLHAGNQAGQVAERYFQFMTQRNYRQWLLYGPCHATGLMEGEPPWIEETSDYLLKENMTYCIDIFMEDKLNRRGLRVEDSVRVGIHGADNMTNYPKEIFRK